MNLYEFEDFNSGVNYENIVISILMFNIKHSKL